MDWHPFRRLIIPVSLLLAGVLLREHLLAVTAAYLPLIDRAPYVSLGLVLLLCAYYNRGRLFVLALTWLLACYLIQTRLQMSLSEPLAFIVYSLLSLSLPLTAFVLLLVPERGLLNRHGVLLTLWPLLLLGIGYWLSALPPLLPWLQTWFSIKPVSGYVLSLSATAVFLPVFLLGGWLLGRRDSEDDAALLAALLFVFVILGWFDAARISALLLTLAGVTLIISLLRSGYEMAYRDELTGLLGRRALNDRFRALAGRYVIAMLDVDYFKKFNDTYGHDVGDDVLKMVAKQIAKVGGGGTAYRYGGEEFSVVFPGKDIEDCEPYLDDVRRDVERYRMALRDKKHRPKADKEAMTRRGRRRKPRAGKTVSVTISIGMAERNENRRKPEQVLKAADKALYKAKQKGRNCLAW